MSQVGWTKTKLMNKTIRNLSQGIGVVILGIGLTGCTAPVQEEAAAPAGNTASATTVEPTPQQELAKFCRVCVVDRGEKIEEYLPSRLDTEVGGQTYKFCTDDCKKKFDANQKPYLLK